MTLYPRLVFLCAIPFVFGETVIRVQKVVPSHDTVSHYLCQDGRRSDGCAEAIAPDYRYVTGVQPLDGKTVDKNQIGYAAALAQAA